MRAPLFVLGIVLAGAGCSDRDDSIGPIPDLPSASTVRDGAVDELPDSSLLSDTLRVVRAQPDHGPYSGGNSVTLRGIGFADGMKVSFGDHVIEAIDINLIDARRVAVVAPAGEPGAVDIRVTVGDETAVLADGYIYDTIRVTPVRGSVAGGTFLRIQGSATNFADGDVVRVGNGDCVDVTVVSETEITCRTQPSTAGIVDVRVRHADQTEDVGIDAFSFYDGTDPLYGGLGGGPIVGQLNVTVLDAALGLPIRDAFVVVGEDLGTPYQERTNVFGQVTFSGDDLVGPVTVHVAKDCFEKTSVVSFDATDVTVFLVPWGDLACIPPGNPGGGGGGGGRNGSFVEGLLEWPMEVEAFGGPWARIPEPKASERRIAYVFATRPGVDSPAVSPGSGGVVLDPGQGAPPEAFDYSIFVAPSAMAVYALAGLEDVNTREFSPYVMGVARHVFVGPGEILGGVNIMMDIPLDRRFDANVSMLPGTTPVGPDRFRGRLHMNLGGEGFIVREINGLLFDEVTKFSGATPFRFFDQPAPEGAINDARYRLEIWWGSGSLEQPPITGVIQHGIGLRASPVQIEGLLGVPVAQSPAYAAPIPADRVLRWTSTGSMPADFQLVLMVDGDGRPAWRHIVPGDVFEAPIPDLSSLDGVSDIGSGFVTWAIYAIRAPGFQYNEFSYRYFEDTYWSHYATDSFAATKN